ncbi:hypothetical protein M9434_007092 [Picochlorum sp. BPE23]|nr:hypothetical protein M9434_007092 [Picochlorum sp. BPE23]
MAWRCCTRRYIGYIRQRRGDSSVLSVRFGGDQQHGESTIRHPDVSVSVVNDVSTPYNNTKKGWRGSVKEWLGSVFLPVGYPEAVGSPRYLSYVGWQALHHACSSANGALASAFLLYSAGLGSATALPVAGAFNWILKDGLGQGATLMVTRLVSRDFDSSTRLWYVLAALQLDVAVGMEIMTWSLPPWLFVPVAASANCLKGLAWMTGGSTRTAFHVSFARMGNIGDITAKATSQTICASLVGTWGGLAIAAGIHQDVVLAGMACACLSGVHIFSSYKSAMYAPLRTLDAFRLKRIAESVVRGEKEMPRPDDVKDVLFVPPGDEQCPQYKVSIEHIARHHRLYMEEYGDLFAEKKYLVIPRRNQRPLVLLHETCQIHDFVEAGICVVHLGEKKDRINQDVFDEEVIRNSTRAEKDLVAEEVRDSIAIAHHKTSGQATVARMERLGWDTSTVMETYMASAAEWG